MVKNNNKKNNGTNALRGLLAFLVALAVFLGVELIPQLTENLGTDRRYIVFCTACGQVAPLTDKVDVDGHLMYDWHRPCPRCGKEDWATRFIEPLGAAKKTQS